MKIDVVVCSAVPAWHLWTIEALRAVEGVEVCIIDAGAPQPPLPDPIARLAGPALRRSEIPVSEAPPVEADLILNLAGVEVAGDPRHGVWSFRLGHENDQRLPFAGEYASNSATFEIELWRRLDHSVTRLRSGRFGAMTIYANALKTALGHAAQWPATFVAAISAGAQLAGKPASESRQRPVSPLRTLAFVTGLTRRVAVSFVNDLVEVTQWNAGFLECGVHDLLAGRPLRAKWFPAPAPLTFIADPFIVRRDGKRVLFVEEFSYKRDRGVIDALTLDENDNVVARQTVLDLPTHLSYPYPLEIDGELYMVPENCAGHEVALYRCVEFPAVWEREAALFPGFDGVDTSIFTHEGRWWALCTRFSQGSTLALYAYYAESARGPWRAHTLNPIVTDVACARPGGQPFLVDGALYRPAQDCTESYGSALAIMRVDVLTPDRFEETLVRRIDARELAPYDGGIHTLSFDGQRLVIDGKRVYRDPRKLSWALRKARARLARLMAAVTVNARSPAVTRE